MRWIVHIGAPKTGSSAIQQFLTGNRSVLADRGIYYPDVSLRGAGHHDIAFLLGGGYARWATPQARSLASLRAELTEKIATAGASTILLSSEIFYLYPAPEAMRAFLIEVGLQPHDDVEIVCYVRRQDDAQVSWYNQSVKAQGNSMSFEGTLERDHCIWRYATRLAEWESTFGKPAITVRDYAPFTLASNDIRVDFLDILGVDPADFALPPARENERINRDILDFQRWVNRLPITHRRKRHFHKQLIALSVASRGSERFDDTPFLTDTARKSLLDSYAADNALLSQRYLNDRPLLAPAGDCPPDVQDQPLRRGLSAGKLFHILRWLASPQSRNTPE